VTDGPSAAYFWGERISNTDKNELATLPRVMCATHYVMHDVTLRGRHLGRLGGLGLCVTYMKSARCVPLRVIVRIMGVYVTLPDT